MSNDVDRGMFAAQCNLFEYNLCLDSLSSFLIIISQCKHIAIYTQTHKWVLAIDNQQQSLKLISCSFSHIFQIQTAAC